MTNYYSCPLPYLRLSSQIRYKWLSQGHESARHCSRVSWLQEWHIPNRRYCSIHFRLIELPKLTGEVIASDFPLLARQCFQKDEKGWRQYIENDIRSLEYLRNMKAMGKSLEESVKHVASLYESNLSILQPDISLQEENPLLNFIKSQQEFNQKILERLEIQEKRQVERDENLMIALRKTLETKKQLAIASQKKRWWQFWKRK